MAEPEATKESNFIHIFAGASIGLVIGVMAGMSASPVVSIIITAFVGLLAAFLGLQDGGKAPAETEAQAAKIRNQIKMNGLRAASVGLGCVVGILLGVFIRANDVLSLSLEERVTKWTKAGYSKEQALQFVVYEKLAILPEGKQVQVTEVQKTANAAGSTVLFASVAEAELCSKFRVADFKNNPKEVLVQYRLVGGTLDKDKKDKKDPLSAFADAVERVPVKNQLEILTTTEDILCKLESDWQEKLLKKQ